MKRSISDFLDYKWCPRLPGEECSKDHHRQFMLTHLMLGWNMVCIDPAGLMKLKSTPGHPMISTSMAELKWYSNMAREGHLMLGFTISKAQLDLAHKTFVQAWHEAERDPNYDGTPGVRTTAGLQAVLDFLGIRVTEHELLG